MFYKIKEEDEGLRFGVGYRFRPFELFLAVPTSFGPKPHLAWIGFSTEPGYRNGVLLGFDFLRDHAMNRPNDQDSYHLHCRRCGQGDEKNDQYCGGFNVRKWPGKKLTLARRETDFLPRELSMSNFFR